AAGLTLEQLLADGLRYLSLHISTAIFAASLIRAVDHLDDGARHIAGLRIHVERPGQTATGQRFTQAFDDGTDRRVVTDVRIRRVGTYRVLRANGGNDGVVSVALQHFEVPGAGIGFGMVLRRPVSRTRARETQRLLHGLVQIGTHAVTGP